ncbi:MAG TPA: metallophosphoesterase [Blastocatellia bacterium]|nr:metallophosphoesterase [Blastocatellia bacterium]
MPWTLRMLMFFTLAGILFQSYVARKTITAAVTLTGWPRKRVRLIAILVMIWSLLYPLTLLGSYFLKLGNVSQSFQRSNLALDIFITYPFWVVMIMSIQLTFLFLLVDAARLIFYPYYKKHKAGWMQVQSRLIIALVCIGVVYVSWRIYNDLYNVRVRETELHISGLPEQLEGFRIVQIADLQADGRTNGSKLQGYVDAVNNLKPDVVLFGGDLVTSGPDYIQTGAAAMGKIEARYGVYACLGDHDHFSNSEFVTRSLQENNVTVLNNVATLVPVGPTFLSLTGITNVYRTRPSPQTLETIEQQRPRGPVNIMLTHQPSEWLVDYSLKQDYNLFVAGHTHGGQIVFPLPGFLLTGSSFETDYVTGFYQVGEMLVSVNNGLGMTLAPVRYHAPAEVTLILLKNAR